MNRGRKGELEAEGDRERVHDPGWGRAGARGTDEDRDGGFEYGGWQIPYFDDIFGKTVVEGMAEAGGFLLGRRT